MRARWPRHIVGVRPSCSTFRQSAGRRGRRFAPIAVISLVHSSEHTHDSNIQRGSPHERIICPYGLRVAITGGTSGLGLALVEAFAARGAAVAFVARDAARVAARRASLPGSHGIVGDVARKDDTHPIALQIAGALGGLDVLVNNASSLGPVPLALLADTECEDFERALATNLLGPFRLTKALLGALAASAREGRGGARRQHHQRRRGHALRRLGRLRREQGGAAHLSRIWDEELRAHGVRVLSPSTRATWTRRCTRWPCPTPTRRR